MSIGIEHEGDEVLRDVEKLESALVTFRRFAKSTRDVPVTRGFLVELHSVAQLYSSIGEALHGVVVAIDPTLCASHAKARANVN